MKKINLKIVTITLSAAMLLSSTSCKLYKNDSALTLKDGRLINLDDDKYSNVTDDHVKKIIAELIEKVEEKNYGLDIDGLLDKLSNTIFIKNPEGAFALGTYNDDEHTLTYLPGDDETIRHELLHMLLHSYNNASLDEGIVQIFLNDLYGYSIEENTFDTSLCKIFFRILDGEELKKFIMGDIDILKNKLASIKPAYEDADQFLIFANNGEVYYRLYNESIFNNEEQAFRESKQYEWLKAYRKVVKDRIKIYLYNYYDDMDFKQDPYDRLVEIFEILNLVNYNMYDPDLGEENEKDYFLKPIVDQICLFYNIDDNTLVSADEKAKGYMSFKYLDKLSEKSINNIKQ